MTAPSRGSSYLKTEWGEGKKHLSCKSKQQSPGQPTSPLWSHCWFGETRACLTAADLGQVYCWLPCHSSALVILLFSFLCKFMIADPDPKLWVKDKSKPALNLSFFPQLLHVNIQLGWTLELAGGYVQLWLSLQHPPGSGTGEGSDVATIPCHGLTIWLTLSTASCSIILFPFQLFPCLQQSWPRDFHQGKETSLI